MNVEDNTGMRPKMGDTSITLPITFDYSGGRADKDRSHKLWSVILTIVGVLIEIGIIFSKKGIFQKLLLIVTVALGFLIFIRYFLLKEGVRKEDYKRIVSNDYKLSYKDIWGIYKVEELHPYICRFRNGKSGLYIKLNKDVVLGKYIESEYHHYEAISDAYNLAGAGEVQMIHIDYMDNVGTDDRLQNSFKSLNDVSNPDLKDLLSDIYGFQQENIFNRVSTFDVYAFLWTGNDITAWNTISRILNCFLDANYRSYQILNEKDLRDLTKVVFNLEDFSVNKACAEAFGNSKISGIVPISVTDKDGNVTIINKTKAEKEKELKEKQEEEIRLEEEKIKNKKSKKKKVSNTENKDEDIFKGMF